MVSKKVRKDPAKFDWVGQPNVRRGIRGIAETTIMSSRGRDLHLVARRTPVGLVPPLPSTSRNLEFLRKREIPCQAASAARLTTPLRTMQVSPPPRPHAGPFEEETGEASPDERANGAGSISARRQRPGNGNRAGNAALKMRFSPGGGRFQKKPEIKNPGLRMVTSAGQAARPPYQAGLPGLLSLQKRKTRNQEPGTRNSS